MAAVASQPPIRTPSGGTTDQIFQPLADCGNGNPAFYHQYFDDFDQAISFNATGGTGTYTVTGTGTFAVNSQDGGVGRMSALTASFEQIQLPTPSFAANIAPKKLFFEMGFTGMSTPALSTIFAGLINTNANFTGTTITDGIYFKYAGATNILTLTSAIGSVATTVTIPTAAYSLLTAATPFALAFYVTRLGDILAYVDTQLVGFVPQSNIGTTGNPQNAGAVARITGPTITTALLTPSLGIAAAAGATRSIDIDYLDVQRER
jgi:hypothetical protein